MDRPQPGELRERAVADEPALELTARGATVLFGLGPARSGDSDRKLRLQRVLRDLAPAAVALRWVRQVHGRELVWIAEASGEGVHCAGRADGLLTSRAGVGLVIWTADCVPVALAGPRAVAMLHAGWRGAAAGIVVEAVRRLEAEAATPAAQLTAVLGPAISGPHYQVGPEVIASLGRTGVPEAWWRDGDRVDLRAFLAGQLGRLGVGTVAPVGPCTFETASLASYRRDGAAAGRQWSLVWRHRSAAPRGD